MELELRSLRQELENRGGGGGPHAHLLKTIGDLENLPILDLKQIFSQLKIDLDKVEKVSRHCSFCYCLRPEIYRIHCIHK